MSNLIPFLSYVFVVTFTPGPNNIMAMVNANKFGYRQTLKFLIGIFSGFTIIMLLATYFCRSLYNLLPKVKVIMGIIGATYMIYLAYKIITSSNQITKDQKHLNSFFTGMLLQFINPKVILYGITVVSSFIIPHYQTNITLFYFSLVLASVAFVSTSCWALFGIIFEKFLSKYRTSFNLVMSLLLIYSAISILIL